MKGALQVALLPPTIKATARRDKQICSSAARPLHGVGWPIVENKPHMSRSLIKLCRVINKPPHLLPTCGSGSIRHNIADIPTVRALLVKGRPHATAKGAACNWALALAAEADASPTTCCVYVALCMSAAEASATPILTATHTIGRMRR